MCQGFGSTRQSRRAGLTALKIHKRDKFPRRGITTAPPKVVPDGGIVDTLLAWRIDVYARRTLRNIVLRNTLGLAVRTLIASRSVGAEYDCFIIRSSSRTWKVLPFFSPELLYPFPSVSVFLSVFATWIPFRISSPYLSSIVRKFGDSAISYDFYPVNNVDFSMILSRLWTRIGNLPRSTENSRIWLSYL